MVLPPSKIVSHPKDKKLPWLLPAHLPSGKVIGTCRGGILIPGFIRSPPMLVVYDVAHSLSLGGVGRDFPFWGWDPRHISYLSSNFRGCFYYCKCFYFYFIYLSHKRELYEFLVLCLQLENKHTRVFIFSSRADVSMRTCTIKSMTCFDSRVVSSHCKDINKEVTRFTHGRSIFRLAIATND